MTPEQLNDVVERETALSSSAAPHLSGEVFDRPKPASS